jgi:hypothetical protein
VNPESALPQAGAPGILAALLEPARPRRAEPGRAMAAPVQQPSRPVTVPYRRDNGNPISRPDISSSFVTERHYLHGSMARDPPIWADFEDGRSAFSAAQNGRYALADSKHAQDRCGVRARRSSR